MATGRDSAGESSSTQDKGGDDNLNDFGDVELRGFVVIAQCNDKNSHIIAHLIFP